MTENAGLDVDRGLERLEPRSRSALSSSAERRGDPEQFGAYVVVEKIASGGMAEIYRAHHEANPDIPVALKLIRPDYDEDPEFRCMLMDEAKIAYVLDHPNIARVLGIEQHEGRLGLILEYVDGLDLGRVKRLAKDSKRPLSVEVAIHVVREVLEGLDFAHNVRDGRGEYLNVVHRDISPGNVMIDVGGRVRLVDFGIARAQNRLAKTEAGNVKGKFRYMAPEQIKGLAVGPYTDVYSAAILLWELLSGKRIYDDVSVGQLMMRVANGDVPALGELRPDLPRSLVNVFARATALEPGERYPSARAFAQALDGVLFEYDAGRCRAELSRLVVAARASVEQKHLERAVIRARFAAEKDTDDLEGALLKALEQPDRVDRVPVDWAKLRSTEPSAPISPVPLEPQEPPTHPMAKAVVPS